MRRRQEEEELEYQREQEEAARRKKEEEERKKRQAEMALLGEPDDLKEEEKFDVKPAIVAGASTGQKLDNTASMAKPVMARRRPAPAKKANFDFGSDNESENSSIKPVAAAPGKSESPPKVAPPLQQPPR